MSDIIFYSFYTVDEFYKSKATELSRSMDELGVDYYFEPIEIPDDKEWPDICRQKILMLYNFYTSQRDKKVVWIDIDCDVNYIPDFLSTFSADIIGFQRGFSSPLRIGYHYKKRFWEPCILGFNQTPKAKKFLEDALAFEQSFNGRATDDYFFEESWRKNAREMSFQVIPSLYIKLPGRENSNTDIKPFFTFGASGNVSTYVDQVVQHKTPWIKANFPRPQFKFSLKHLRKIPSKSKIKLKSFYFFAMPNNLQRFILKALNKIENHSDLTFKINVLKFAKAGDWLAVRKFVESGHGFKLLTDRQKEVLKLATSFIYYANYDKKLQYQPIYLAWWSNPEPGNMGDWLSPYVISKISNRSVLFVNPQAKTTEKNHYFSTGSIGKFTKENSVVLGTGISARDAELNPKSKYIFVRGPLTRDRVIECGGDCPEIYGDPAIVMPLLYRATEGKKNNNKYLLVRHFTHRNLKVNLTSKFDELSILVSHPKDIESFIDTLHMYQGVVTSAMHCFILCQAYGIPCALVTFENAKSAVHGDGMKYLDYMRGVGVSEQKVQVVSSDFKDLDINSILSNDKIENEKIETLHKILKNELE